MLAKSQSKFTTGHSPFLQALLLVSIVLGLQLALVRLVYETQDDIYLAGLMAGVLGSGHPTSLVMFSNVLVGGVLKNLFAWAPHWPWYTIYLLAVQFTSHLGLLWALLTIAPGRRTLICFLVYQGFIGTHFLSHFAFTTTSFLAAQSGIALIAIQFWCPADSIEIRWSRMAAGVVLLTVSSLIRTEMFLLISGLSIPLFIALLLKCSKRDALFRRAGATWSIVGLMAGLAAIYDYSVYDSIPEWREYKGFHRELVQVVDFAEIDLLNQYPAQTDQILKDAGWTRNDFRLIKNWCFLDESTYSRELLAKVGQGWKPLQIASPRRIALTAGFKLAVILTNPFCLGCLILAMFCLPSASLIFRRASQVTWLLCWLGMGYLCTTRKLPARVFEPIVIFSLMSQLLLCLLPTYEESPIETPKWKLSRWIVVGLALVVLVGLGGICRDFSLTQTSATTGDRLKRDIDKLATLDDRVIVAWHPFPLDRLSPFEDTQTLGRLRLFSFGAFARTPHAKSLKEKSGFQGMRDFLKSDSKILLASFPANNELLLRYLFEHEGVKMSLEPKFQGESGIVLYEVKNLKSKTSDSK